MPLYKIENSLELIKEKPFKYEKEIQHLVEKNLKKFLNLDFIKSEFALHNFRIDTLAFDDESNSFVIIEFKRDKSFSVVDQGYAYLSLMLNNKSDFILEYNENKDNSLKRNDVDWSQSKVIFISPNFTNYQKEAINFKDLPIELWEIKQFENEIISFGQIQKTNAVESFKTISSKNEKQIEEQIDIVKREIKVYTEETHLNNKDEEIIELYHKIKGIILNFGDNVTFQANKMCINFRINNNIFCDITILAKSLKIYLNLKSGELKDELQIARDVSNIGHWGNGSYEIKMNNTEDIEYISSLIKQSYKKNQ